MIDRCERTNENGESAFWEGHWLERSIKKIFHSAKSNARKNGQGTRDMGRNGIFFKKIKHGLKTNMLYCFLLVLHNSSSSATTSFLSLPCCHTTFFLLLATVQDSSAIPLVKCGNPPSTLLLGSQSCTFIKGPFRPSCIPFDETIDSIFKPPTSTLSSTHVGVCVCVGCVT